MYIYVYTHVRVKNKIKKYGCVYKTMTAQRAFFVFVVMNKLNKKILHTTFFSFSSIEMHRTLYGNSGGCARSIGVRVAVQVENGHLKSPAPGVDLNSIRKAHSFQEEFLARKRENGWTEGKKKEEKSNFYRVATEDDSRRRTHRTVNISKKKTDRVNMTKQSFRPCVRRMNP